VTTQVNFDVLIFELSPELGESLGDDLRNALQLAVYEVLKAANSQGYSVTIRGPEIVSLFH
jgi:hypothetical protein